MGKRGTTMAWRPEPHESSQGREDKGHDHDGREENGRGQDEPGQRRRGADAPESPASGADDRHTGDPAGACGGGSASRSEPVATGAGECRSEILARLTLSALERGAGDPGLWREPAVHRAVLVSGLSLLVAAMRRLRLELSADGA